MRLSRSVLPAGTLAGLFLALGSLALGSLILGACAGAPTLAGGGVPRLDTVATGTQAILIGLDAAGPAVWAAGALGTWARSLDGGRTWTTGRVPGADTLQFRDVAAFSAREAALLSIGTGEASRVYTTEDAGATWTLRWTNAEPEAFYDCFAFWPDGRGFAYSDAVGGRLPLIRTADRGRTWADADGLRARPGEGAFASSGTCAVAGDGGVGWAVTNGGDGPDRLFTTRDFGATWTVGELPVSSADPARGLATLAVRGDRMLAGLLGEIDGTTFLESRDGGRSWRRAGRGPLPGVYGLALVRRGAVAVGPAGLDVERPGLGWRRLTDRPFWSAHTLDDGTVVAVGPRGRAARITF